MTDEKHAELIDLIEALEENVRASHDYRYLPKVARKHMEAAERKAATIHSRIIDELYKPA